MTAERPFTRAQGPIGPFDLDTCDRTRSVAGAVQDELTGPLAPLGHWSGADRSAVKLGHAAAHGSDQ
jgi:hypothetical protein